MSGKPRKRPRTLSEKISERDLQQGRIVAANSVQGHILHAASLQFCLCWGDDGYDPLRSEVVALFPTREDFELANRRRMIPDSKNCALGESAMAQRIEVPFDHANLNAINPVAHVVFETVYEGYADYSRTIEIDHSNYLIDGSGVVLKAFGNHQQAADDVEKRLFALLGDTKAIQWRFWKYKGLDWKSSSSHSRWNFSMALESLGIDIGAEDWESDAGAIELALNIALGVDVRDPYKKVKVNDAQRKKAMQVLELLDKFRFFKVVTMPILQCEEF